MKGRLRTVLLILGVVFLIASTVLARADYTKLNENGNDLPDTATTWIMVRDNTTGLIWEVKTDDGSIHDKDNQYTWYDARDYFIAKINSNAFGGYNDWRVPTRSQLCTLVDLGYWAPRINTEYFPNTPKPSGVPIYWTSTNYNSTIAYLVNFTEGSCSDWTYKSEGWIKVRAVSRGQRCTYSISPLYKEFLNSGGSQEVSIDASDSGCPWSVAECPSWLSVSPRSGQGDDTVTVQAVANPGSPRSAVLVIAGKNFSVSQEGSCSFMISPKEKTFPSEGGVQEVSIDADSADCEWHVDEIPSWVSVTPVKGVGDGKVTITVQANSGEERNGTMNIAWQSFNVGQDPLLPYQYIRGMGDNADWGTRVTCKVPTSIRVGDEYTNEVIIGPKKDHEGCDTMPFNREITIICYWNRKGWNDYMKKQKWKEKTRTTCAYPTKTLTHAYEFDPQWLMPDEIEMWYEIKTEVWFPSDWVPSFSEEYETDKASIRMINSGEGSKLGETTFPSGTECSYTSPKSVNVGPDVMVESEARITIEAPTIILSNESSENGEGDETIIFHAEEGSYVHIGTGSGSPAVSEHSNDSIRLPPSQGRH